MPSVSDGMLFKERSLQKAERNTKQKQAVYEALCSLDHPTATEVFDCVRATHPSVSRGTVFRVLGGFAESGKVRKLRLSGSDARYDVTLSPHAHARCRVCGKVAGVALSVANALENARAEGFAIEGCEVQFYGVCAECTRLAR